MTMRHRSRRPKGDKRPWIERYSLSWCFLMGTLWLCIQGVAADKHEFASINALLAIFLIGMALTLSYVIKKYRIFYLPESAATMLLGMIVGGIARLVISDETELSVLRFQPELFFFLLLPPIIFEAGYTLKRKRFFRNFMTIIMFAVLGTLVSAFVIGGLIYGFAKSGVIPIDSKNPLQSLLFGALISAVDPVATLSIMGHPEINCDKLLYSLVFGESVLNDAVSIVLFNTFASLTGSGSKLDTFDDYILIILKFFGIALGSIVLGVVMGLLACFIFKHSNLMKYPSKEITVLFLFAYASYAVGESIELSGIMSLFFTGIVLSHYNWYNMSTLTRETSRYIFKAFAHTTETVVYAYMGMVVFTGEYGKWSAQFISLGILCCLIGRALNTFPLANLANLRRKLKIPAKMQFVIWFAGLRGAIAFALSLNMPKVDGWKESNVYIVTTTLSIVIFTTVVAGGLTEPILGRFDMKRSEADVDGGGEAEDMAIEDAAGRNKNTPLERVERSGFHVWFKSFDKKVMKRYFGGKPTAVETAEHQSLTNAASASNANGAGYGTSDENGTGNQPAQREPLLERPGQTSRSSSMYDGDIGSGRGEFFGYGVGSFDDDEYRSPSDVELDNED
eukprot:gb/GECG01009914.1/.p1 GENE.gb/GECG01009914.1/~~gb/GECG01009914.1/.p1  ORF type:complete len:621 (+),score=52.21 gb/GECG01009914.1/:1-1863(+)